MRNFVFSDAIYLVTMAWVTVTLALVTFAGGMAGGVLVALARASQNTVIRFVGTAYVRVFQGTPLLIQIMIAFFAPSFFLGFDVDGWTAAVIALTLNASAYSGEIIRGSIEAVPRGQWEASRALGLNYVDRMRDVVLPQALRIAIPPLIGLGVQLIKGTSLASVVSLVELTRAAARVNAMTLEPVPIFGTVCLVYFVLCWPLSFYGRFLEKRMTIAR